MHLVRRQDTLGWFSTIVGSIVYNLAKLYIHPVFALVIIIYQWNQTACLYENQVTFIYSRAISVTVTSVGREKRVICKIWTGTLVNSADLDQTRRLIRVRTVCLNYRKLKVNESVLSHHSGRFYPFILRDNRSTSAVSALIWQARQIFSLMDVYYPFEKKSNIREKLKQILFL